MILQGRPCGKVGRRQIHYSAIAQWWSTRLLTDRLEVRVLFAEPLVLSYTEDFFAYKNINIDKFAGCSIVSCVSIIYELFTKSGRTLSMEYMNNGIIGV